VVSAIGHLQGQPMLKETHIIKEITGKEEQLRKPNQIAQIHKVIKK
jgi:hypothetical protein